MATKYYNDATGDHLWSTLGNWWDTSPGVGAATTLPATGDTVFLTGNVTQSAYAVEVANLTITGSFTLNCILTVNGSATFATTSKNGGIVNGTCVFNTSSENNSGKLINGNCTFNDAALNYGKVVGTTTFNNTSINKSGASVTGATTFNASSSNESGASVTGACTFNTSATCAGSVTGACTFNNASVLSATTGIINGACAFNNTSSLAGTVYGNCTFLNTAGLAATGTISSPSGTAFFSGTGCVCAGTVDVYEFRLAVGCSVASTAVITVSYYALLYGNNSGLIQGVASTRFDESTNLGTVNTSRCQFYGAAALNHSTGVVSSSVECEFDAAATNDGNVSAPTVDVSATSSNTGTITSNDCRINDASKNSGGLIVGVGNFYGSIDDFYYANNTGGTVTGSTNSYWPATYPVGGSVSVSSNYYGYAFLQGQAQIGVRGIVDTLGIQDTVSLGSITGVIGLTAYGKMNVPVTLSRGICNIGVKGTLRLTTADAGFTVKQALAAIYSVWGAGCSDGCDAAYTAKGSAALDILNGCMQEILLNSKELQYLSRETLTLQLESTADAQTGLFYVALPDYVQAVVGPVRFYVDNNPDISIRHQIIGVSTKSQIMNFSTYYATPGGNTIYGYWIDRAYQATGDRSRIRIYISGSFADAEVAVDVEREALRYRAADCASGTVIPLPHQYAESLLLPLLREAASASPYASRRDSAPMYQTAAAAARTRFAQADPQNPVLEPQQERKRKP